MVLMLVSARPQRSVRYREAALVVSLVCSRRTCCEPRVDAWAAGGQRRVSGCGVLLFAGSSVRSFSLGRGGWVEATCVVLTLRLLALLDRPCPEVRGWSPRFAVVIVRLNRVAESAGLIVGWVSPLISLHR